MVEITKVIEWDMGHRVPNHKNKCRNPHGHRYRLEVTIKGEMNRKKGSSSEGMIYDFGDIKSLLLTEIHDVLDHNFMVYEGDAVLRNFFQQEAATMSFIMVSFIPTAENIVQWCGAKLMAALPAGLVVAKCRLFETPNSWADFIPSPRT